MTATATDHKRIFEREIWPAIVSMDGLALRYTRCPSTKDDLVQRVALKAWRFLPQYLAHRRRNPTAWVRSILRTQAINLYWERRRREDGVLDYIDDLNSDLADPSVDEQVDASIRWGELMCILDSIDDSHPHFAETLRMRLGLVDGLEVSDDGGIPYRTIADAMGVPIGTVMSRLYRGRAVLDRLIATDETTAAVDVEAVRAAIEADGLRTREWSYVSDRTAVAVYTLDDEFLGVVQFDAQGQFKMMRWDALRLVDQVERAVRRAVYGPEAKAA